MTPQISPCFSKPQNPPIKIRRFLFLRYSVYAECSSNNGFIGFDVGIRHFSGRRTDGCRQVSHRPPSCCPDGACCVLAAAKTTARASFCPDGRCWPDRPCDQRHFAVLPLRPFLDRLEEVWRCDVVSASQSVKRKPAPDRGICAPPGNCRPPRPSRSVSLRAKRTWPGATC
jgi:hypothetical protein